MKKEFNIFILMGLLLIAVLSSCSNGFNDTYIVSKEDSIKKKSYQREDGIVIMPPTIPYGQFNFVIDSSNVCYYYYYTRSADSVKDEDVNVKRYRYLGIKKQDVIIIPKDCVNKFIYLNILKARSNFKYKSIIVSTFKDTVNNQAISYLKHLELDSSNHINLTIRLASEEERLVIVNKNPLQLQ